MEDWKIEKNSKFELKLMKNILMDELELTSKDINEAWKRYERKQA